MVAMLSGYGLVSPAAAYAFLRAVGIIAPDVVAPSEQHLAETRRRGHDRAIVSFERSAPLARVQRCIGALAGL
jgi:hypothetical protein